MAWQDNGDYHVYKPDGSLFYVVPKATFTQWKQQGDKIKAALEESAKVWREAEAKRKFDNAVQADLAAQARKAGFTSDLKLEDFL